MAAEAKEAAVEDMGAVAPEVVDMAAADPAVEAMAEAVKEEEVAVDMEAEAVVEERSLCPEAISCVHLWPSFAVYLTQNLFKTNFMSNCLSFVKITNRLKQFNAISVIFIKKLNFSRLSINYFQNKNLKNFRNIFHFVHQNLINLNIKELIEKSFWIFGEKIK